MDPPRLCERAAVPRGRANCCRKCSFPTWRYTGIWRTIGLVRSRFPRLLKPALWARPQGGLCVSSCSFPYSRIAKSAESAPERSRGRYGRPASCGQSKSRIPVPQPLWSDTSPVTRRWRSSASVGNGFDRHHQDADDPAHRHCDNAHICPPLWRRGAPGRRQPLLRTPGWGHPLRPQSRLTAHRRTPGQVVGRSSNLRAASISRVAWSSSPRIVLREREWCDSEINRRWPTASPMTLLISASVTSCGRGRLLSAIALVLCQAGWKGRRTVTSSPAARSRAKTPEKVAFCGR